MKYTYRGLAMPERIVELLKGYVNQRLHPGQFLAAVLENNLQESISRADDECLLNLPVIVIYIYNNVPGSCWGSPEKVKAWLEGI